MAIKHVLRQWLVAGAPMLSAISSGGALVYPTILIEQFKNEPAMQLNLEIMSWIGSINGLAGIPSILMPHLMQWKGRKIAFITTCILMMTGWLFAYSSTNIIMILVGESFHGLGTNSLLTISQLSVSEMMAPRHRNIALLTFGESQFLGLVLGAIMARFLHWKTIALIMCIPVVISMLMAFAWPESPSWLASKGKFERCEKAFTYLRGTEANEQNELYELITAQKINLSRDKIMVRQFSLKRFCQTITRKDFYKPIFHIIVLMFLMYWTGNMVIVIYCIEIIKKTTSNEISSYSSIIVNCIVLIGFTINNVLIRFYNNKTVILVSTFFSALSLLITSIVSYLQYVDILAKDSLLCLLGLIIFMAASSLGLIPGVFTIAAEIMPVKHRGLGGAVYIICTCLLHGSSLKAALYLFLYLDLWGTLLIYTLNASLCGLILWKYLPETKDKSLQDIENYYMFGRYSLQECLEANNKLVGDK